MVTTSRSQWTLPLFATVCYASSGGHHWALAVSQFMIEFQKNLPK
jgi:hypothetical protein